MSETLEIAVDIEEQRQWLRAYKADTGLSWSDIEKRIGRPAGTISNFCGANGYSGKEGPIAEAVARFRHLLVAHQAMEGTLPEAPEFFETETSRRLHQRFSLAQRGRMAYGALCSGLGKSKAAKRFATLYSNVFIARMSPSTAGLNPMQGKVLAAMGEDNAAGTPQKLTIRILEKCSQLVNPLLIIDEAQELTTKSIEEIRGWNDEIGLGIVLLGDERLHAIIQNGTGKAALPQLRRRMLPFVRTEPYKEDVEAQLNAWDIRSDVIRTELFGIAKRPGGLGNVTQTLELAWMIAIGEGRPLELGDVKDGWAQVTTRQVQ